MRTIEVVLLEDLKAYFDGFTLSQFKKGEVTNMDSVFAHKLIEAGICKVAKVIETKPAFNKKETKVARVVRKAK